GDGVAHRKRAFATKLGKSRPFNIIGRHDHLALEFEGVMKRDDVRMGQAGVDPHLPREALAGLAIPGGGGVQRAERFNLAGRQVPDFVSNAGARLIDDIEALVFADYLVNSEGHGWSRLLSSPDCTARRGHRSIENHGVLRLLTLDSIGAGIL